MSVFSAFKSISSNINSNYTISPTPTSTAGPWGIHDAKKKSNGKAYSVFIFDRKSLDSHGRSLDRSSASSFKRAANEVVERLRKEASSLAKLRHPNILELVEPVEDTRGGGLQFASEAVTTSLSSLLAEKDERERSGGPGGRASRFVVEDADGVRRRRELEIDELEIQKGLLQISKALEFFHENAGLVHGNLTPDAILINAKSDWKISGLAFCSPAEGSNKPTSIQAISLSEALSNDPRLPKYVQLNLDYTSPDFVLDNNLTTAADMFSLGLLCIALYNSPHKSPMETHSSISTYRRLFSSSSTVPSASNKFLSSGSIPRDLAAHVLPRLITRRPAQRMTAREFEQSEYFDNILVSTIRFLDAFPAKAPGEKQQFLRGLVKVLPSFPKSVLEKKLLPSLLDEMKDKDLISLILQSVFKIIDLLPSAKRAFSEKVRPALKETFVAAPQPKQAQPQVHEKDLAKDAGLMVVLEHMSSISKNCSGKEFKDDILPVILTAIESPTHSLVDAALRGLPAVLPVLDFSTIKNELFPVIAAVFSKTSSLQIKIRGLRAFVILCGGSPDSSNNDGLDGFGASKKTSSSSALDKYTMQEKIIPLIRAIKTKEPAVMMAAHDVLKVVGDAADIEFIALEILPILWHMGLGPLLSLKQFQTFMELIRGLSRKVEEEHASKLQELSGSSNGGVTAPNDDFMSFGGLSGTAFDPTNGTDGGDDFEALVKGRASSSKETASAFPSWDDNPPSAAPSVPRTGGSPQPAAFSWSTPAAPAAPAVKAQQASTFRTVTPDLSNFNSLTPTNTQFSKPLQPNQPALSSPPLAQNTAQASSSSMNWSTGSMTSPTAGISNPWASGTSSTAQQQQAQPSAFGNMSGSIGGLSLNAQAQAQRPALQSHLSSSFSLPPPPGGSGSGGGNPWSTQSGGMGSGMGMGMGMAKPAVTSSTNTGMGMGGNLASGSSTGGMGMGMGAANAPSPPKSGSGLDKYESLL